MADPDLQIRGEGASGHPDPETRGEGGGSKNFFSAPRARPQFGLKIRGGPGLPRLLCIVTICNSNNYNILL